MTRLLALARLAQRQARTAGRGVWLYQLATGHLLLTYDRAEPGSRLLALVTASALVRFRAPRRTEAVDKDLGNT